MDGYGYIKARNCLHYKIRRTLKDLKEDIELIESSNIFSSTERQLYDAVIRRFEALVFSLEYWDQMITIDMKNAREKISSREEKRRIENG